MEGEERREYADCDGNCYVVVRSRPDSAACFTTCMSFNTICSVSFHPVSFYCSMLYNRVLTIPVEHTPRSTQIWNLGEATKTAQSYGKAEK